MVCGEKEVKGKKGREGYRKVANGEVKPQKR